MMGIIQAAQHSLMQPSAHPPPHNNRGEYAAGQRQAGDTQLAMVAGCCHNAARPPAVSTGEVSPLGAWVLTWRACSLRASSLPSLITCGRYTLPFTSRNVPLSDVKRRGRWQSSSRSRTASSSKHQRNESPTSHEQRMTDAALLGKKNDKQQWGQNQPHHPW
jgi:hypothetical protein